MNRSLWTAALAMTLLLAWGAVASAGTTYTVNGTNNPPALQFADLKAAVDAANTDATPGKIVTFSLTKASGSDVLMGSTITDSSYYGFLASAGNNDYASVAVTGNTTNNYRLGFTGTTNTRIFAFDNTGTLAMTNLDLSGGDVTRSAGLLPGGGTGGSAVILLAGTNPFTGATFQNMNIHNNNTLITGIDPAGHMAAGAVLIDGRDSLGAPQGTVNFTNVILAANKATMANGDSSDYSSNASGGGARLVNISTLNFNGKVSNNQAVLEYGNHAVGGGLDIEADGVSTATITNTTFDSNSVTIRNNITDPFGGRHHASGGAVYFYNGSAGAGTTGNIADSFFTNNQAVSQNSVSQGGAVHYESNSHGAITGSTFTNNSATSATGEALGGAVSAYNTVSTGTVLALGGNTFQANTASGATASGGAVFNRAGAVTSSGDTFRQNRAAASDGNAYGGALYLGGDGNTITGATIANNSASARKTSSSAGDVYAQGGAIFANQGKTTITDSTITGNTVTASGLAFSGTGYANGGAIFMNTADGSTPTQLFLNATSTGGVTIANNYANGKSSGIHFGARDGLSSVVDASLTINANGKVHLLDPITAEMGNHRFDMTKNGGADFTWDGVNTFNAAYTTIALNDGGRLILGDKFTAKMTRPSASAQVNISANTHMDFNLSRNSTVAMFDFTGTGNPSMANFNVAGNVSVGTVLGRQLLSLDKEYLVASGLDSTVAAAAAANLKGTGAVTSVYSRNGNVIAGVRYDSPLDHAGQNTDAVKYILQDMANTPGLWTDQQVEYLRQNPWGVTPENYMSGATIMLQGADAVSRAALEYGVVRPWRGKAAMSGTAYETDDGSYVVDCDLPKGYRLWAGYVGDFSSQDQTGRFDGYTVDRNGFLIGVNYDFGGMASIGVYSGYTRGEVEMDKANSKSKSNNGHGGVIARLSPIDNVNVYGDAGYHFAKTRTYRTLGGNTEGSYNQHVITAGLGAEYVYEMGSATIIPFARARYSKLYQGELNESGFTAAHVNSFNESAFNTRLGIEAAYDFETASGVITPSINLAWRHEYGSRSFGSSAYFTDGPAYGTFTLNSARIDRDSADLGAAIRAAYETAAGNQMGFNVAYNYNLGRHSDSHNVYAGFELGF